MFFSKGTIVYIGGMEMPDLNAAAHRVYNNAKIFAKLGYHVVFCGVDRTIEHNSTSPICFGEFESYPSKYPNSGIDWLKQLFDFSHILFVLKKVNNLKMVVAYNMHAKPLKKLINYCKKNNIKVIADATEWYENKFSFSPIRFIKWYDTRMVMQKLQKKVDGIIVISSFLKDYYKSSVYNIVCIPPLVDVSEAIWHPDTIQSDDIVFMYSGVPGQDKDKLGFVLSVFSSISKDLDFHFNIFGLTKEQFLANNKDLRDALEKMNDKVSFYGKVSHMESVKNLFSSDYCIFIRERTRKNMAGFPTKYVECVTSGIGIITSDVSDIKSFQTIGKSFIIETVNQESLSLAILEAVKNGKTNHLLTKTFDYNNYIDSMEKFVKNVLDV